MSNDKTSKDFELVELEKPLTEQEMKETTGGVGEMTLPPGAPARAPALVVLPTMSTPTPVSYPSTEFGYTNEPMKIPTPPPKGTPLTVLTVPPRTTPLPKPPTP